MGNLFHITSVLLWIVNPSNPTRGCIEHFSAWKELMYKTIWSLTMSLMSQSKKWSCYEKKDVCVLPLNQRLFSAAVVLSTAARPYLESIRFVNGLRMCLLFPMPRKSHLVYFVRRLNYVRSMWRVFALFFSSLFFLEISFLMGLKSLFSIIFLWFLVLTIWIFREKLLR